jgi:hypothetical protein
MTGTAGYSILMTGTAGYSILNVTVGYSILMTSSSIHETRNKSSQNQEVGITTMSSCCPPYLSPLMYICAVYTPCKHKIIHSSWVHMINVDSTMCSISPKFTFYYQNVQCFVTLKKKSSGGPLHCILLSPISC